ncbi:hypothetical protein MTP03_26320 [Tsukamurella sp. PLM1]|nr:hypothetical protein MTP03_26320 [Tsukamurella sp. PLM1]
MDHTTDGRRALWVFAHPSGESLNAALRDAGVAELRRAGWSVDVDDLYAEGFDPVLVDEGGADVRREQRRLLDADLLILQYPLWWYGPPAMLKGWIDRVFERGFAYDVADPATGRKRKYGDGASWDAARSPSSPPAIAPVRLRRGVSAGTSRTSSGRCCTARSGTRAWRRCRRI